MQRTWPPKQELNVAFFFPLGSHLAKFRISPGGAWELFVVLGLEPRSFTCKASTLPIVHLL